MILDKTIPSKLRKTVDSELSGGEMARWIDMPVPRFFTKHSMSLFLFSIPWTAFAIFWICGASGFSLPDFDEGFDFFPLFGVPFVLIGIGMIMSPLWAYRAAGKTVYVITNKRAITVIGGFNTTVRSYYPENLKNIYKRVKRDGTGDIIIERETWRDSDSNNQSRELGFLGVKNVNEVERLLKSLAEQTKDS